MNADVDKQHDKAVQLVTNQCGVSVTVTKWCTYLEVSFSICIKGIKI